MGNEIGKRLEQYRLEKKLSQKQLAIKIGCSIESIYRWESGQTIMNVKNLAKLITALDVTADQILFGK